MGYACFNSGFGSNLSLASNMSIPTVGNQPNPKQKPAIFRLQAVKFLLLAQLLMKFITLAIIVGLV